ncbi:alpha/beta hydrolase family protein [Mangrovihabitans endophyticus]|uniref:Alpha/beta hydrolase n=1 Tax=Mangrovihabitans endophyticus TaxID=1751298 RepID=A0A8J3C2J9_9ACTN|nr:alpha/beta fold hydrolase [Mangrovihabitans endophyticus]GGK99968.1 alpha/beta hydrolase [Mangrovihabitans endophyticus]
MPDSAIETALAHWAPRMIQNGVDYNDLMATTSRTRTWADWLPQWNRAADEQAGFARQAEAEGHVRTAGQAWLRASVNRHFGKFVWMLDLDLAAEATRRSVTESHAALARLDPSGQHLEVNMPGGTAYANLRRPSGIDVPPYVVLIPGLDSTKEEFFWFEQSFLDRGMATVSLDGPGQGETGLSLPLRPDYETAAGPLLDLLAARTDLDHARIGVAGVSLGGYYAPRVAAHEPRVSAVAGISGPFCFGHMWDDLPPMTRQTFVVKSGARDDAEGRRIALTLDLTGVCRRITAPALYVTGERDRLIPWQQTQRQADETPDGTFVCFPEGNHGVSNLPSRARPMIADWMADRLGAASGRRC